MIEMNENTEKITQKDEFHEEDSQQLNNSEPGLEKIQYNIDPPLVLGVAWSLMKEFLPESIPTWHSLFDELARDRMRENIFQLILQRQPNPTPYWITNLEAVTRKVEERLYFTAANLEDYKNTRTLVARIETLVKDAGLEASAADFADDAHSSENDDEGVGNYLRDSPETQKEATFSQTQVSSQGCSRVFIVKVLASVSEFVSGKLVSSIFTFPRELVLAWFQKAKDACCSPSLEMEEEYYGGPSFLPDDPVTHWTEPHQLYTWWKNNIERKVKFKIIQNDATYEGPDLKKAARARWCAVIISLTEVIRCSSGSTVQARPVMNAAFKPYDLSIKPPKPTGSPEIRNFGNMLHSLPSIQYPLGTTPPSAQMTKMQSGFNDIGMSNIIPPGDSSSIKSLIPQSSPRSLITSAMTRRLTDYQPRQINGTQLLLGDSHGFPVTTTPNGYFVRQLPSWTEERDFTKLIQGQTPQLNSAWKEEAARAKEALAQKRALFKERSDQIKATVSLNQKGYQQAFPLKLFDLVTEQNNDIICWLPEGNAFKVKHMENFVNIILPAYFKHGNFTSFQRQLNLYGFRRTRESDKGAYYHVNFLAGKRDLAAGIRRLLTNHQHQPERSLLHGSYSTLGTSINEEQKHLEEVPPPPAPTPPPESAPRQLKTQTAAIGRRAGTSKSQKSPQSKVTRLSEPRSSKNNSSNKSYKESELYSIHPEPKHDYGTRRKRLKKQFDEFITNDDIFKRNRKEHISDEEVEDLESQSISQHSNLPMVYVSGLDCSQDCDEVIDMTIIPNQRKRITTRRILIDMTPTLQGREAIVTESQVDQIKRSPHSSKLKDENGSVIYNTTLSNVSHSKLTRVGVEYQAVIPELLPKKPHLPQKEKNDCLPVLSDEINNELQAAARKREQIFLSFATSQVIVAVIPNSNSRRVRRSATPPSCILPDKALRTKLLSAQFTTPSECIMSIEMKKSLFPRLCVALRRVVLIQQKEKSPPGDRPVLYFQPEGNNDDEIIESPIWGCDYLCEEDSSDSELEWSDCHHPRVRDMSTMMSDRYDDTAQSIYLEVTDGTQNWIVPLVVCASAGSLDYQEYFLQTPHPYFKSIISDDLKNPTFKYSPMELQKLGWIDVSMNIFFLQISPLLKRSNENLSRAWRDLENRFDGNPWPSSMKEFIFFCQRYCPHPTDSTATCDSRVVAMRRLINMTSDIETPSYKIEELLEDENDKMLLSRYLLPAIITPPSVEIESGDDEEEELVSETDGLSKSRIQRKHALLTNGLLGDEFGGEGYGLNEYDSGDEEGEGEGEDNEGQDVRRGEVDGDDDGDCGGEEVGEEEEEVSEELLGTGTGEVEEEVLAISNLTSAPTFDNSSAENYVRMTTRRKPGRRG